MKTITIEESGAFIEAFSVAPTADGPLAGLRFAVKDLIDVAGHATGCGNPTWLATHPPAAVHAVCVEQLLAAGGQCVGKTLTDEVAFSLIGENHFYGTPLNPAAPDRVPGGSSNGSASAVACGLADFALGTDTGGSVRFPASNCGLWGLRPSHGLISVAGVMPFAPTFDTIGILAKNNNVLEQAATVLLASPRREPESPSAIHLVTEAFDLAVPAAKQALQAPVERLSRLFPGKVRQTSLTELLQATSTDDSDLNLWREVYCVMQWSEIRSSLGAWMTDAQPQFGPRTASSMQLVLDLDRSRVGAAIERREHYFRQLRRALAGGDLLCIPTAPDIAPLKGAMALDRTGDYYRRALALTSLAGLGRLPQVSMPLATCGEVPLGLSLLSGHGDDLRLLAIVSLIADND